MFKGIFTQQGGGGNQLVSSSIKNRALGCNPALGLGRLEWSAAGNLTGATIELYADLGSGYVVVQTGIDPLLGISLFDVSGLAGFTSLDAIDFRVNLVVLGIDLQGSPQFHTPTYPCA